MLSKSYVVSNRRKNGKWYIAIKTYHHNRNPTVEIIADNINNHTELFSIKSKLRKVIEI